MKSFEKERLTIASNNSRQIEHEMKHDLRVTKNENYNTNCKNQWRNSSRVHNFSLTEPTIYFFFFYLVGIVANFLPPFFCNIRG